MANAISKYYSFAAYISDQEFIIAMANVPPIMLGVKLFATRSKRSSRNPGRGVIAEYETPPAKKSVIERFLNGNLIVTWKKE